MAANRNRNLDPILKAVKARDIDECNRLIDELAADHSRQMALSLKGSLYEAVRQGLYDFVDLLLTKGAKVNDMNGLGQSALSIASREGHFPVVDLLLSKWSANIHAKDTFGNSAMMEALFNSGNCCVNVVDLLLSKGALINDKDKNGYSCLHIASQNGHVNVVDLLLSKGAPIDDKHKNGYSSLHFASMNGHVNVVDLLLSRGAPIDDKHKNGYSCLHIASMNGHVNVVDLLLSKGAPIDDKHKNGYSCLHIASQNGHVNVVDLLLSRGADLRDRSNDGLDTCFSVASSGEIISVLRKWPTSMGVLVLQELGFYYLIDCSSMIDLHQFVGKEDYTSDAK